MNQLALLLSPFYIPNLYWANPGDGRNVTSIRGITTTSYDPTVATYIDGVNQFSLDTYVAQLLDIERIEVLRGPQGTLYGRNATGGDHFTSDGFLKSARCGPSLRSIHRR